MTSVEELAKKSRIAIWLIVVSGVITGAALIGLAYSDYRESLTDAVVREQDIKITQLRGDILQFDKLLTLSATMAAQTGDRQWEKRYRIFEAKLKASIKEMTKIVPAVYRGPGLIVTDLVNAELVEMENQVFVLVRQNRLNEAQAVLVSEAYKTQKRVYSLGMEHVSTQIEMMTNANLKLARAEEAKNLVTALFIVLLLTGVWAAVLRTMIQSQRGLLEAGALLTQKTDELTRLNTGLEFKATARAKDLEEARVAALNMMEDAVEAKAKTEQAYEELLQEGIVRKQAEETIERMAYFDTLTELPNRNMLRDRLLNAIQTDGEQGKPMALLLMDLNQFKEINDTLGHQRGDLLLKQVGQRLRDTIFDRDLVARLGGDEFAILLVKMANEGDIGLAIDKILKALEMPFVIDGIPIVVESSIGVAFYPGHGTDPDILLQRADMAMYEAKKSGSGHAVYKPEYDKYSPKRLALMAELRYAIEHDELVLYYQPKISFKTKRITDVEALVRWNHPKRGIIPPVQFIETAEQTGAIYPLTRWVLDNAMRQCRTWREAGIGLSISVNLSVRNLQDPKLPGLVADLAKNFGIPADGMTFEITESAIMADPERALEVLDKIHKMGFQFSIDDFGIGHSSLNYLRKLPVSWIKVDRSFIMNMMKNENDAAIVRSTIDLAHNLGLKVVAEGVETEAVWDLLAAMGCDIGQGYYMSKPLPADQLGSWVGESPWGLSKT